MLSILTCRCTYWLVNVISKGPDLMIQGALSSLTFFCFCLMLNFSHFSPFGRNAPKIGVLFFSFLYLCSFGSLWVFHFLRQRCTCYLLCKGVSLQDFSHYNIVVVYGKAVKHVKYVNVSSVPLEEGTNFCIMYISSGFKIWKHFVIIKDVLKRK